jgi:septal ring factor EnvC (AmiA/AmiB activator)
MRTKIRPKNQNPSPKTRQAGRRLSFVFCFLSSVLCLLFFAGCDHMPGFGRGWQTSPAAGGANTLESPKTTAVDSAIELSDRYAKLSDETSALRMQNRNLEAENQRLKTDLKTTQDRLEKAQKDLNEVNDLLVEMRVELNNWKTDVLGFRGEMREAEKAQLEALIKILKILGAEIKTDSPAQPGPAKAVQAPPAPSVVERPASVPEEQK